jgi:hypothetical protein
VAGIAPDAVKIGMAVTARIAEGLVEFTPA